MEDETSSSDISTFSKSQLDSLDVRICSKFFTSRCLDQDKCLLKHTLDLRDTVCKYFLIHGYCYKGPMCPFLHQIIKDKLPVCRNETEYSKCRNPSCKFSHITKECPFYKEGYCRYGKSCRFQHIRRTLCRDLTCRNDEKCMNSHPKGFAFEMLLEQFFKLKKGDFLMEKFEMLFVVCSKCLEFGHYEDRCEVRRKKTSRCYRCYQYGHKTNECESCS